MPATDLESFVERHWMALLLGVTLIGALLRCYGLSNRSLWYDEAVSIYGSRYVNLHLDFIRPEMCREMPLNALLTRIWYPLVAAIPGVRMGSATSDFLLRLMPCATSVMIVPATFLLARQLLRNTLGALLAAFLIAISPFQVVYAQELRPHALFTLATAVSAYYMLRAFEEDRTRYWISTAIWMAVSLWAYYMAVFFFVGMNALFLVYFPTWKKHFWKWVITQGVAGVLMLPAVLLARIMLKYQQLATEFYFPFPTARTAMITLKDFLAGYSPTPSVYLPLFGLAAVLSVLGVWQLRKRPRVGLAILTLVFVPMTANILFWYTQGFPYYTHRAQLPSSVPFAILIAAGLIALRRPALVGLASLALAALTAPTLADHYAQRIHPSWDHRMGARYPVDIRGAADYIRARMQPGDMVGNVTHFTQASFQYHYLDVPQHVLGFTEEDAKGLFKGNADSKMWKSTGWVPVRVEDAIAGARRVWLVTSWWEPYAPAPNVAETRAWFDAHGLRLDHVQLQGLSVYLYDMDPALRPVVHRAQVADNGDRAVYRYTFSNGPQDADIVREGDESLRKEVLLRAQDAPAPLQVDFDLQALDTAPQAVGSIALTADAKAPVIAGAVPGAVSDRYTGKVRIVNNSDKNRAVQGLVYEPEALIEALAFDREAGSDVWRPGHQVSFNPPPPFYENIVFSARVDREVTQGSLRTTLRLAPGKYTAYAHFAEECIPENRHRAYLHGALSDASGQVQVLRTLSGYRPEGVSGWRWRELGEFTAPEGDLTLVLTAANDDRLDRAYFDLDRVMIVPGAAPSNGTRSRSDYPRAVSQFEVKLAPHQEQTAVVSGAMDGAPSKNVEIEIQDLVTRESRRLFSETVPLASAP